MSIYIHGDVQELISELNSIGNSVVFGGYLRDLHTGHAPNDVDIATNIPIETIEKMYGHYEKAGKRKTISGHDVFSFKMHRTEKMFVEIVSSESNVFEKSKQADYTVNSLIYNGSGLFDFENGVKDINNKIIKEVNIETIRNDLKTRPYLWLKTIRLMSILNFDLSEGVFNTLKENTQYLSSISDEIMQTEGHKTLNGKGVIKVIKLLSNFGYITSFDYIEVDEKEFSIQPHQKLCLLAVLIGKNPIDDFIKFYRFNDITKNKYEELYNAYFKEEKIENRLKHQITTIKKILEDK